MSAVADAAAVATTTVDYDARYQKGWAYGKSPNAFLVTATASHLAHRAAPMEILSLGEGQGRNVAYLAGLGHRCVAVDQSSVGLSKTLSLASSRGIQDRVSIVHADLYDYQPGGADGGSSWDVIISIFCALPAARRRRLHRACAAALRPGGMIIIEAFAPQQASIRGEGGRTWSRMGPSDRALLVSADDLREDFRCGNVDRVGAAECSAVTAIAGQAVHARPTDGASSATAVEVLICQEVSRRLQEGQFHRGTACVTQCVVRRPSADLAAAPSQQDLIHLADGLAITEGRVPSHPCVLMSAVEPAPSALVPGLMPAASSSAAASTVTHAPLMGASAAAESAPWTLCNEGSTLALAASPARALDSRRPRQQPLPYHLAIDTIFSDFAREDASAGDGASHTAHSVACARTCDSDGGHGEAVASRRAHQLAHASVQEALASASPGAQGRDRLLACAAASVRIACEVATRHRLCRYCWVAQEQCFCNSIDDMLGAAGAQGGRRDAMAPLPRAPAGGVADGARGRLHWVFLTHPNEFLRSTSTAKLAARILQGARSDGPQLGGTPVGSASGSLLHSSELLVYGTASYEVRVAGILSDMSVPSCGDDTGGGGGEGGVVRLLFPGAPPEAQSATDALRDAIDSVCRLRPPSCETCTPWARDEQPVLPSPPPKASRVSSPLAMTVLVPDGSWECARALVRDLEARAPPRTPLRSITLDASAIALRTSPLLEALHQGSGQGRLSTLEAAAQLVAEIHWRGDAEPGPAALEKSLRAAMHPLIEYVRSLPNGAPSAEPTLQASPQRISEAVGRRWMVALQKAAHTAICDACATTHANGLRRCVVCHAALATPHHMQSHLVGRRHCLAVARRHLDGLLAAELSAVGEEEARWRISTRRPTPAEAAAAFERLSSAPLRASVPEPPDVALIAVQEAWARTGQSSTVAAAPLPL